MGYGYGDTERTEAWVSFNDHHTCPPTSMAISTYEGATAKKSIQFRADCGPWSNVAAVTTQNRTHNKSHTSNAENVTRDMQM